jgi:hypothetical protein
MITLLLILLLSTALHADPIIIDPAEDNSRYRFMPQGTVIGLVTKDNTDPIYYQLGPTGWAQIASPEDAFADSTNMQPLDKLVAQVPEPQALLLIGLSLMLTSRCLKKR